MNNLQTIFKTLMYGNEYIEVNLLDRGLYSSTRPYILHREITIDRLIELAEDKDVIMRLPQEYIDNLKKCELVTIQINVIYE